MSNWAETWDCMEEECREEAGDDEQLGGDLGLHGGGM